MPRLCGLAGLVAAAVVLTGCGAVPELTPGVAVRVAGESMSTQDVHATATDYCAAQQNQAQEAQQEAQPVSNHYLNGLVVGSFALRSAAEHVLAEQGVAIDASYQAAIDAAEPRLAKMTAAERDAMIQVGATSIYVQAAELSIGRAALGGSPSDEEAQAAGQKEVAAWLDDNDLRIDPRYGVSVDDAVLTATDTGVSFAVSDVATRADAPQPDAAYAATLPATQRCG